MSQEWFDKITDKTNCDCAFCIAMWKQMEADKIDGKQQMNPVAWQMYEFHLEAKHRWSRKDIEA